MNTAPDPRDRLAARFRHFADVECPQEPLYQAVCRIVAGDARLLDLLSGATDEQQRPNLWLAAVHDALLSGVAHPLAAYYPSVGGARAPDAALAACLRDFVARHEAALRACMRTRTTQTNEIGRCAVLWPALHAIAARCGTTDLALLDVGCSAGLNLGVDQYRYRYDATPGADEKHDASAPGDTCGLPLLTARSVGAKPLPQSPTPRIVQRCGIDPAPVSVDDAAAVRWLRACLWPSDATRATRFEQAVALMRTHRWPVHPVADCTAFAEHWVANVPPGVQPVIFNSWVLTYFEPPALKRHIERLTELVHRTGAMWLSAEGPHLRIGPVEVPPPLASEQASGSLWTLCSRVGDEARFELLARSHAHGRWVEWL